MLQAAATGLSPEQPYVLALSSNPKGDGPLKPLAGFMSNPAGAAIVNAIGPIRQVVQGGSSEPKRFLVIVSGTPAELGRLVQVQLP